MNEKAMTKKCVVICGPTASGKSSLAVSLAKEFNGGIVSADSMQIYRELDLATAKPNRDELAAVVHRMIDICSPDELFSVHSYQSMAKKEIDDFHNQDKLPFLVGGTGLYIDSILRNTHFVDIPTDPSLRQKLEEEYDRIGPDAFWQKVKEIDPDSAKKLFPKDKKRTVRAMEIYCATGHTQTHWNQQSHTSPSDCRFLVLNLNYRSRSLLYQRIDSRVDQMMADGLLQECRTLFEKGVLDTPTASQAIGYKEMKNYITGKSSLEEALSLLKQRSRNYAKRQITWFKRYSGIQLFMDEPDPLARARAHIQHFLEEAT